MPIKYTGNTIAQQLTAFRALKQKMPRMIGNEIVRFSKDNFRKKGWQGDNGLVPWKARQPPLISRYRDGQKSQRGIMIDTGRLMRSIRIIATSPTNVVVASVGVPYAQIHNEGGTIVQTPTFRQRMFFSHLSNTARGLGDTAGGNLFAAISTASTLTIEIPQRQFLAPSKTMDKRILEMLTKELEIILKP